jgi:hypothetical protein
MVNHYTVDRSNEWQYVDGVEDLIYTPNNPAAPPTAALKAKRSHPLTQGNSGAVMGNEPVTVHWHIWIGTMGAVVPKGGDFLTDEDGVKYTIESFFLVPDQSQYKIFTTKNV